MSNSLSAKKQMGHEQNRRHFVYAQNALVIDLPYFVLKYKIVPTVKPPNDYISTQLGNTPEVKHNF